MGVHVRTLSILTSLILLPPQVHLPVGSLFHEKLKSSVRSCIRVLTITEMKIKSQTNTINRGIWIKFKMLPS